MVFVYLLLDPEGKGFGASQDSKRVGFRLS
jgi:hypothetical protein